MATYTRKKIEHAVTHTIDTHKQVKKRISDLPYRSKRDGRIESNLAYKQAKADKKTAKRTYKRVKNDDAQSIVNVTIKKRQFTQAKQATVVAKKTKQAAIKRDGGTIKSNVAKTTGVGVKNDIRDRLETGMSETEVLSDLATSRQKIRHVKNKLQTGKISANYARKGTGYAGRNAYSISNKAFNFARGKGFVRTPKTLSIPHRTSAAVRKRLMKLRRSKVGKTTGRSVKILKFISKPLTKFIVNPLGLSGILYLLVGVVIIATISSALSIFSNTSQSTFDLSDSWKLMTYYDREKSNDKADYYTQLDDVMIYANAKNDDYQPTESHTYKVKKGDWIPKQGTYGTWLESLWEKMNGDPYHLKSIHDIYADEDESKDFRLEGEDLADYKEKEMMIAEDGSGKYPSLVELDNPLYLPNDTANYQAPLKVIKRYGYSSKDTMFNGMTIQANQGHPVYAALDGKVDLDPNGTTVRVYSDNKTYLSMTQLTAIQVKQDQQVKVGVLLGYLSEENLTVYYRKYRSESEIPPFAPGIWEKLDINKGWTYINPGFYFEKVVYLQNTSVISDISSDATSKAKEIAALIREHYPSATNEGIAAFLGNWYVESGINPKRAEGDYLQPPVGATETSWDDEGWLAMGGVEIYNGAYPNIIHRGLGLGQWTDTSDGGVRHTLLLDFAKAKNQKWYDLPLQIDFMLNGDSPGYRQAAMTILEAEDSPAVLAGRVQKFWEGNVGDKTKERANAAEQMFQALTTSTSGSTADIPAGYEDKVNPKPTNTVASGNAYPSGQCTWGAYNRLKELGKNKVTNYEGNGGSWWQTAQSKGLPVHKGSPKQHEAVSFPPGVAGSDVIYGHIAVVEVVNSDGSFLISETNAVGITDGKRTWRVISASDARNCYFIDYS